MKAVVVNEPGGPEKLVYTNIPTPTVRPGWSLVKVKGFGINHSEIFTRKGLSPTVKFPRILGIECVGVIAESTDSAHLPVGQRVVSIMGEMGRAFDGSYAEYVLVPNDQVYPVTTDLDWATLATVPETYYTAYGPMLNLRLTPDDDVLIRGATNGVEVAFLNLTKACYPGIRVAGTTRSPAKKSLLVDQGFDEVIVDHEGELQTARKFTKIFELIGPATVKDSFKHTEVGGIVCSTGELGNQWYLPQFDPIMDIAPNAYLTSFYSGNVDGTKLNRMLQLIEEKHVAVKPTRIFHLDPGGCCPCLLGGTAFLRQGNRLVVTKKRQASFSASLALNLLLQVLVHDEGQLGELKTVHDQLGHQGLGPLGHLGDHLVGFRTQELTGLLVIHSGDLRGGLVDPAVEVFPGIFEVVQVLLGKFGVVGLDDH